MHRSIYIYVRYTSEFHLNNALHSHVKEIVFSADLSFMFPDRDDQNIDGIVGREENGQTDQQYLQSIDEQQE